MGLETWPRFRGEDGSGISSAKVPTQLNEKSLLWSAPLPGPGSSSPVIWGESLFVTSEDRAKGVVSLVCLDAKSGKTRWTRNLETGGDYKMHRFNNMAAATPAVSEKLVVVAWYSAAKKLAMLSAFDHEGKSLWTYEVGPFKGHHGINLHPEIYKDQVIVAHLHLDGGYVGAISAQNGKVLWKTPYPGSRASYVTPLIREVKGPEGVSHEVIVASQSTGVVGLDFKTGREKWVVPKVMNHRTIVSPFNVLTGSGEDDCLIAVGCKNGVYITVRPPRLQDGKMTKPEVAWKMKGRTPYVPTPVSDGRFVYVVSDGGVLAALDARSGVTKWEEKLMANFYASPLLIGGKLYCLSREGEMIVADVGDAYQESARSRLKLDSDTSWADATPAVAHGRLYVRLGARLDCFGAK